jgi:cyclin G-associated kinase
MNRHSLFFSRSINRGDLDLGYVTTRIAIMSFPAEGLEMTYRNAAEEVRGILEAKHQGFYMVYNVSGRPYNPAR